MLLTASSVLCPRRPGASVMNSMKQQETGSDVGGGIGCWGIMAILGIVLLLLIFVYLILV